MRPRLYDGPSLDTWVPQDSQGFAPKPRSSADHGGPAHWLTKVLLAGGKSLSYVIFAFVFFALPRIPSTTVHRDGKRGMAH